MSVNTWLLVALGAGAGTYVLRAAPFLLIGRYEVGKQGLRFLVYTSLAIAAGIVSKYLVMWKGEFSAVEFAIKLAALMVSLALYARFKNVLLSLFTGVLLAAVLKLAADY